MKTIKNIMIDDTDLIGSYTFVEMQQQVALLNSLAYKGFNNWRIPSKKELNLLYRNKGEIGGLSSVYYWSSSEYNAGYAWKQYFSNGTKYRSNKDYSGIVRCVRSV